MFQQGAREQWHWAAFLTVRPVHFFPQPHWALVVSVVRLDTLD
jgi:hypothetical protein